MKANLKRRSINCLLLVVPPRRILGWSGAMRVRRHPSSVKEQSTEAPNTKTSEFHSIQVVDLQGRSVKFKGE